MEEKICSVFGHSQIEITEELRQATFLSIQRAIEYGCRIFYFGGYSMFDDLCYQFVTQLQQEYPSIKRIFCVPQERYLRKKSPYFNKEDYDDVIYLTPAFEWWYKSIYFRNCAMIDDSDYVIFYAENRKDSGAYKAYTYAKKQKGKQIINLYENKKS